MANPQQLPTERGPSPAQFGPQGGQAPRPAVTLPADASGPPINPDMTKISPNRMLAVKQSQMGGPTPGSDSMGSMESLEDALKAGTKMFAQIMMKDPSWLPIILEIGRTMAGEDDEGGPGNMDNAAVVGNDAEEREPMPARTRPTTMRPQGAPSAQRPPQGGGPTGGPGASPTSTPPMRPGGGGGGPMPQGRPDPRRALQAQMAAR